MTAASTSPAGTRVAKDDRVIYNKNSGDVSYDADGKGGVKAIKFLTLDGSPDNLSAKDFRRRGLTRGGLGGVDSDTSA